MSFMQKLRAGLGRLMAGRRGPDELSLTLLLAGIVLSMLSSLLRVGVLYYVGMAAYVLALFRIFSRNLGKRYAENAKFMSVTRNCVTAVKQFFIRIKNIRKYKYFKCPECHSRLRLPRKVGEVTVTCGKCHHAFKHKA